MQNDTPPNGTERGANSELGESPLHEAEPGPTGTVEFDPEIANQLAAIGDDYGRERSRRAMRTGLAGPAASCTAAIGCGAFGGMYIVAGAFLFGIAVLSLVRFWKLVSRSELLDDAEKATWRFRIAAHCRLRRVHGPALERALSRVS